MRLFVVSAPINAARPNRQRPFSRSSCRSNRAITHERAEIESKPAAGGA